MKRKKIQTMYAALAAVLPLSMLPASAVWAQKTTGVISPDGNAKTEFYLGTINALKSGNSAYVDGTVVSNTLANNSGGYRRWKLEDASGRQIIVRSPHPYKLSIGTKVRVYSSEVNDAGMTDARTVEFDSPVPQPSSTPAAKVSEPDKSSGKPARLGAEPTPWWAIVLGSGILSGGIAAAAFGLTRVSQRGAVSGTPTGGFSRSPAPKFSVTPKLGNGAGPTPPLSTEDVVEYHPTLELVTHTGKFVRIPNRVTIAGSEDSCGLVLEGTGVSRMGYSVETLPDNRSIRFKVGSSTNDVFVQTNGKNTRLPDGGEETLSVGDGFSIAGNMWTLRERAAS